MAEREELVQYYIVDATLGIRSKGKIGAQCAHGALLAHEIYERLRVLADKYHTDLTSRGHANTYNKWYGGQMTKIVLKGDPEVMEKAGKEYGHMTACVIDSGFTEVPEGSQTVVVLPIMKRDDCPDWLTELRLL